jgi:hypothetical protein
VLGLWRDFVLRLSSAPVVSIARIRGRTRGIGNEFVLACDMRLDQGIGAHARGDWAPLMLSSVRSSCRISAAQGKILFSSLIAAGQFFGSSLCESVSQLRKSPCLFEAFTNASRASVVPLK